MLLLLLLLDAVPTTAPQLRGQCPDLPSMRTAQIAQSFDGAKLEGLWYEHAFIDIAQAGAACQTMNAHFNGSTKAMTMDFRVKYGPVPFTIVEDYIPVNTSRGVFVKQAEMPGSGLLTLPTVVVDAQLHGTGSGQSSVYDTLTLFSCTSKLGLLVTELIFATRSPSIDVADLAAMQKTATAQGVHLKPGQLTTVNHTKCKTPDNSSLVPGGDTIIRPPPGKVGQVVGMVMIQGAQIPTARYEPLAQALVEAVPFPLSIALPGFIANLPEPLQIASCVSRAVKYLALPQGAPIFAAGHSLGAVMIQDFAFKNHAMFDGLILMGGALQRKYRNGTASYVYPLPHLVLDGMLDGLYRSTRQAESFFFAIPHRSQVPCATVLSKLCHVARLASVGQCLLCVGSHQYAARNAGCTNPSIQSWCSSGKLPPPLPPTPTERELAARNSAVIVFEGVNHMQFASGVPPATVVANDLPAEISDDAAHAQMASTIAAWLLLHTSGSTPALHQLETEMQATGTRLAPLIMALEMEGFAHFTPPCNSDFPMPMCPLYQRYPGKQRGSTPQLNCTCGTPWSKTAQVDLGNVTTMGGVQIVWDVVDAIHSVSDINPVHLPHIFSACGSGNRSSSGSGSRQVGGGIAPCTLNVTTVTQPMRASLDSFDTGFSLISATELRVKLKSRQSLMLAAGAAKSSVNFTRTDVEPSLCATINQKAYEWALANAGSVAVDRFRRKGTPLVSTVVP